MIDIDCNAIFMKSICIFTTFLKIRSGYIFFYSKKKILHGENLTINNNWINDEHGQKSSNCKKSMSLTEKYMYRVSQKWMYVWLIYNNNWIGDKKCS